MQEKSGWRDVLFATGFHDGAASTIHPDDLNPSVIVDSPVINRQHAWDAICRPRSRSWDRTTRSTTWWPAAAATAGKVHDLSTASRLPARSSSRSTAASTTTPSPTAARLHTSTTGYVSHTTSSYWSYSLFKDTLLVWKKMTVPSLPSRSTDSIGYFHW